ncbi:MAG: hypothetical protein ACYTBP_07760 [Planctomycetota bacterium]
MFLCLAIQRHKAITVCALLVVLFSTLVAVARPQSANALVLLDSSKASFIWAQQYVIPYLDHFGVPYHAIDRARTDIEACWDCYPLIIVAHPSVVAEPDRKEILKTVETGTGLLSFDPDFPKRTRAAGEEKTTVLNFNTKHYITSLHKDSPTRTLFGQMSLPEVTVDQASVLVKAGDNPLLIAQQVGNGRIAQWTSQQWMRTDVLGPLGGLDDCLWRSIVWAARKPFAMRHLPPIVTMRVDDVAGRGHLFKQSPLYWVRTCGKYNFKPWLGLFIYNLTPEAIEELRGYIDQGIATASPHALGRPPRKNENQDFYYSPDALPLRVDSYDEFAFFNHHSKKSWPDDEVKKGLSAIDGWYAKCKLPMSNYLLPHWYEIGSNTVPHIADNWPIEFIGLPRGLDLPYDKSVKWLRAGPFRLYERPRSATKALPVYYADFIDVGDHRFFNCLTEIRDDAGYEWAPNNNIKETTGRGVRQLKRALDAKALAVLFTHETDHIYKIRPENWDKELKAISKAIVEYDPIYLRTDDALKIVRAHKTGRLTSCTIDSEIRQITVILKGLADVPTSFCIYSEKGRRITSRYIPIPVFTDHMSIRAQY